MEITVLQLNTFCTSSPFIEIAFIINAFPTGSIKSYFVK